MKPKLFKFVLIGILLCSFSLQSYNPPLPGATAVELSNIPSGYYAVNTHVNGYDIYNSQFDDECTIIGAQGTEVFTTTHKAKHDPNIPTYVAVGVYVKQYSYSNWTYYGQIESDRTCVTKYLSGDYLFYMKVNWNDLAIP